MRGPVLPVFLACVLAPLSGFGGSLWREAVTDERGMFADKRAHRLGDIVTVLINESFESVNTKSLTTSRQAAGDPGLGTNLLNTLINGVADTQKQGTAPVGKFPTNLLPKPAGKAPAILAPPVNGSTNANTASVSNVQTLTNPNGMTVQVIDVLPNGNLVIEGIREVAFSKERQFASLRGIIRPTDILRDNTVKSSQVADARIDVVSEGDLSSTQKKGWLQRLDDKISPY
jgi:flagellar L-ring protein precursor FlgH